MKNPAIYGVLGEFSTPTELVGASRRAYQAGYRKMDAYSPFPIEELHDAIGFHKTKLPLIVLVGGLLGAIGGYGLQYWVSVVNYPLNVGGRPLHSWPSFIPVTFETTVLAAALSAVFGMIALNGLPRPYNPLFNVRRFALASHDRFFLCLEAEDPKFDAQEAANFLRSIGAHDVVEVPH